MDQLYTISGKVYRGDQRGKALGYPTANIALHEKIPEGIYAATVTVDNTKYQAATFVGSAKTFNKSEVNVESYLLDFDQDIYDKLLTVTLHKKIRDNQAFATKEELVEQMDHDVAQIRTYFAEEK